ncbi:MAG: hypothetical protein NXI18_17985 [Alphaproteobacteria bacterium]|jgi:hypothetical protein|nr:hypothetical protein [Alphaproteobacteria bacterium]
MSDTPITPHKAWLELFLASCELKILKQQCDPDRQEAHEHDPFGQTMAERISSIEASLAISRDFIAQQDPDVRAR